MLHPRADDDQLGAFCQRLLQRLCSSNALSLGQRAGGKHDSAPACGVARNHQRLAAVQRIGGFFDRGVEALTVGQHNDAFFVHSYALSR
ncbi:hypothetical protein D3C75_1119350 [compost metagenome]